MHASVKNVLSKLIAIVASLSMVLALAPVCALASTATEGTVDCGNGWVLNYSAQDGSATITGVQTAGNGKLDVPSTAGGSNRVESIGTRAFQNASALKTISIPDSVTTLGDGAFFGAGLTTLSIPSSVQYLPDNCFRNCSSLASITFADGMTLRYMGQRAFSGCSSLISIDIPPLTGTMDSIGAAIGAWCFSDCTSLTTMRFLSGGKNDASGYFYNANCVQNCNSLKSMVYYCKKGSLKYGIAGGSSLSFDNYYTIDFYNSKANATAKTNRVARVTLPSSITFKDVSQGKVDMSLAYAGSDAIPTAPSGKVWGFTGAYIETSGSLLDNSYDAVAVEPDDMNYAFMYSPEIYSYNNDDTMGLANSQPKRESRYFLNEAGTVDLSDIIVYGPDFNAIDQSMYSFSYQQYVVVPNQSLDKSTLHSVDAITEAGTYLLTITGKAPYQDAKISQRIYVDSNYYPACTYYTGSAATAANNAVDAAASAASEAPSFVVAVPASDWRYGLIGSGLAGVGGGFVVYMDDSAGDSPYRAITDSKTDAVNILGGTDQVSKDQEKRIKALGNMQGDGSVDRFEADTPQELAVSIYKTIKRYGPSYGYNWSSTAVIASASSAQDSVIAARYAHSLKAPVFLTEDDGSLSSSTLNALAGGSFTNIIIAGNENAVPASTASSIQSSLGVTPQRIATDSSYWASSLSASQQLDATMGASSSNLVVASANKPASVLGAAEYAALCNAQMLVVSSSEELENLAAYINSVGKRTLQSMTVLGDFSAYASDISSLFDSFWTSGKIDSTRLTSTFSSGACLYKITGANTAELVGLQGVLGLDSLNVGTVEHDGVTCSVTAVKGGVLTGTGIISVKLDTNVKSVSSSFFQGATQLKSVSMAGVTSIAAGAFNGCSKLQTINATSSKLASIGTKAFNGCKALKTLTIKSSKLSKTKVKNNAFKGTNAKVTVKVPAKKLKSYKKIFTDKGLSKKAKFAKC